jgi:hypothetical protein
MNMANSYCFIVIVPDGKEVKEFKRFYRGEDAAFHCLKDLREVSLSIKPILNQYPDEEEVEFQEASKCYMCGVVMGVMQMWKLAKQRRKKSRLNNG